MLLNNVDQAIYDWGQKNIEFIGNKSTNRWAGRYSGTHQRLFKPIAIVDHISEGTMDSLISWFTSRNNRGSSSHFGVGRNGKIVQFVKIEDRAWCNGKIIDPSSDLVNQVGKHVNPNHYTVSIEHEGVWANTHGKLTPEQLDSTIMLHAYIIIYVKKHTGYDIPVSRKHILGHYEIDSLNKINCPGQMFQFEAVLAGINEQLNGEAPFLDIQDHWGRDAVIEALALGLVKGDGTKYFKPDKACTNAQVTQIALNLYHLLKD
jgi:N-acetyl-anhydromuramyl-L-alanine amidase AmpD